jgi:branched-subunit amino acid aminotransferase/4-amino-4-deoxychorismate lyase
MPDPQAYLNGQFVPASQAVVPVFDAGFVQGTTVAEQLRTFGGTLFRLEMHVERLLRSLAIVEVELGLAPDELARIADELVAANHPLLTEGDDLGLAMFVTPGNYSAMVWGNPPAATVCLHTFPLRFGLWAEKYVLGESLATTHVEQVPSACWPPELKCRSRMHYYLADRAAQRRHPGSRALLLDRQGFVVETTTANVVLYREDSGLLLPPASKILPGISLAVLFELAEEWDIHYLERDLKPVDVAAADEVFLTSTSPCMVPVVQFNGKPIGSGRPGPMFGRLMSAWNDLVGLDIVEQAQRFAKR